MPEMSIKATRRDVLGKKMQVLRRKGITPAHLFGHNLKSEALSCDTTELAKILSQAGTTRLVSLNIEGDKEARKVFVREIQRDIMSRDLLHVDFYQVRKDEKMEMAIPVILVGEAPAMRGKGRMVSRGLNEIKISCLPEKVPPHIEVDISVLTDLDKGVYVSDIKLDSGITIHDDPQQLIVKVTEVSIKAEEGRPVAAAAAVAGKAEEGAPKAGADATAKPGADAAAAKPAAAKPAADKK